MLTEELKQAIKQAYIAMHTNSQHELLPTHRLTIYKSFGPLTNPQANRIRTWLAFLTAEKVLPLWQQSCPNNHVPHYLLMLIKDILLEKVDKTKAQKKVEVARRWLERLGVKPNKLAPGIFFVGEAALEALYVALGDSSFEEQVVDEQVLDSDLDPWHTDTAGWAVIAWAGDIWEERSNSNRRHEFWEWWLYEAIPEACRKEFLNS